MVFLGLPRGLQGAGGVETWCFLEDKFLFELHVDLDISLGAGMERSVFLVATEHLEGSPFLLV